MDDEEVRKTHGGESRNNTPLYRPRIPDLVYAMDYCPSVSSFRKPAQLPLSSDVTIRPAGVSHVPFGLSR